MDGLPPLPASYVATLDAALDALDVTLSPAVRAAIDAHARLLLAWTESINLTALRRPEQVALEHVADSLAALPLLRELPTREVRLLDLGSGAGYPGLPLAVALPAARAVLVDSIAKKAAFLEVAARVATETIAATRDGSGGVLVAPLPRIDVERDRAEALGGRRAHRARWDVVVARAVASLPELVELAFPLLVVGGRLLAWKRDDGTGRLEEEISAAMPVLKAVGGGAPPEVRRVTMPGLEDHRILVLNKHVETPRQFPRQGPDRARPLLP